MSHTSCLWQSQYELISKQNTTSSRIQETSWENCFLLSRVPPCSRPVFFFCFFFLLSFLWFVLSACILATWTDSGSNQTSPSLESYCKGTVTSGLEIYSTWSCLLWRAFFSNLSHFRESTSDLKADFLPGLKVLLSIMVFSTESVTALSSVLWNHEIKHLSRQLPFKTVKSKR